jgi:FtsZ-binding cell division protein ZapB
VIKTPTPTLASALDTLARDIETDDGVANAAIAEAAQRLREQEADLKTLADEVVMLMGEVKELRTHRNDQSHRHQHALNQQSAEIERLKADLARAQQPWSVRLTSDSDMEQRDCRVIDVGHADRILVVECEAADKDLATLRAVVDKLPVTADGVRLSGPQPVWVIEDAKPTPKWWHGVATSEVCIDPETDHWELDYRTVWVNRVCYSTPAAAEKAMVTDGSE